MHEAKLCSDNIGIGSSSPRLRHKYPDLAFFDWYRAALAIAYKLGYGELDPVVRAVVEKERSQRWSNHLSLFNVDATDIPRYLR